jgi:hypothetical protein
MEQEHSGPDPHMTGPLELHKEKQEWEFKRPTDNT